MQKISRQLVGIGACVLVAALGSIKADAANRRKPNLLFIMTDQQRFDAMSCAGNEILETPNMDRLAREGAMFNNCYSANPICVPARASLLTGLSSTNVRVLSNKDITNKDVPDVPTFDSVLKDNGYAAEYYGKWHTPFLFTKCYDNEVKVIGKLGGAPSEVKAFQAWLESKGVTPKDPEKGELYSARNKRPYTPIPLDKNYDKASSDSKKARMVKAKQSTQYGEIDMPPHISLTAFTAEETLEALDRLKDKTFTLTCSFDPPHPPTVTQEPYFSMYPPEKIPVPESINDPMTTSPYARRAKEEDQLPYRNPDDIRQMRSIYYGMVREVDDWLGRILTKLDDLGLTENTMVVFTSDHGEMLGDHGLHSKMIFYEASVHVPLLIRFPGRINPGTVVDTPVCHTDVCPTILDYLGMPIPKSDGISLRPYVDGKKSKGHSIVSFAKGGRAPNYMIRVGDLKLMMTESTKGSGFDALYDLKADPQEMRNLLVEIISPERNRAQAKMMQKHLVDWLKDHEPKKAAGIEKRKLF